MRQPAETVVVQNVWTRLDNPASPIWGQIAYLEGPLEGGPGLRGKDGKTFFTGLLPLLQEVNDLIIDDRRKPPTSITFSIPDFVDRDYQKNAVDAAIKNIRGVINIPTGGGKTRVAAGVMATLPGHWLYLVHRSTLVEAAAKQISGLLGEEVGQITANKFDVTCRITCATFDSIASESNAARKRIVLDQVDGIIIDEAHKLPSHTALGIAIQTPNAYYRIGLSATPFMREDRKDIHTIALLGPEIFKIEASELVKQAAIVSPTVKWISCSQQSANKKWNQVYQDLVVNSRKRNTKLVKEILAAEKPAIVFVKEVDHVSTLMGQLRAIRPLLSAESATGQSSISVRNSHITDMNQGKLDILVCTNIFSEGLDIPNLRSVFNCTGESSWKESIQRLGRGTRPAKDKETFTVFDVADMGNKWLTEHTVQRYLAYRAAGFRVDPPTAAAYFRQLTVDKREAPSLKQMSGVDKAYKGAMVLLGILSPIFLWVYYTLFHAAKR